MKMKLLYSLLFVSVIVSSCKTPRFAYSPPAHNVPVLTKQGDSKIGILYSTNANGQEERDNVKIVNRSRGYDLQGAVAITNHFAIQAGHAYRWEKTNGGPDSITVRYKRNLTEAGLGYYTPISAQKNIYFQFFAGGGFGRFSFTDADKFGNYYYQADMTKFYLQPALQFKSKGSFTTSIAYRISNISYSKIKTSYSASQLIDHDLDDLNSRSKWFMEPASVSSFGFKGLPGLRFEVQASLSFLLAKQDMDYRRTNFSIGSWIDIASLFGKN